MFYLTGIQHTTTGDVVIPTLGYNDRDSYLKKYHEEMAYAMNAETFLGLTILVFDNTGSVILHDNWIKEPVVEPEPEPEG